MKEAKTADVVIAIDPDVEKSGCACLETGTRKLEVSALAFPELLDYLRFVKRKAEETRISVTVLIEAGWLNKAHWHLTPKDTRQSAAAKGNAAGRNHETGRKIAEMCSHWQIPFELVKPLALTVGGASLWQGKDGKITQEELSAFTGLVGRTNQEGRDAALIAWEYAGFPVRTARKQAAASRSPQAREREELVQWEKFSYFWAGKKTGHGKGQGLHQDDTHGQVAETAEAETDSLPAVRTVQGRRQDTGGG